MEQFLEMLKGFGAASPLLILMWLDRREKREDYQDLKKENAELRKQLVDILQDAIKSDITNTLVLEKIADKVGA